jgi:NhaP-type Na+/H+ or K+/H+ antiporter
MEGPDPAFTLVLALALGVVAQSVSRHLRIPGIVLLLLAGVAVGPGGLGWVRPNDLGAGLFQIVDLAVAVILFEGGLNLDLARLRREQAAIRNLVTWGALVTMLGAAAAGHAIFDHWGWRQALLFGSLVTVTGPTVVSPLVRRLRLRSRVATVLEAEGVLIDPIGAFLAVLMLGIALVPSADSITHGASIVVFQLAFGTVAGGATGFAIVAMLRARHVIPEGHENIFVLASVLLLFQGCDLMVSHSGILAVTVAGVVVGNFKTRVDRDLREFKDQLTVMLIGLLFVLLAAAVRLEDVQALGWRGAALVAVLVVAIRPLNVWISTRGTDLTRNERWFIAWVAPRGIVAAAIASVTANALETAGMPGGAELRALVFLVIAGTVLLAGFTALPVAQALGVRLPGRDTVAILGALGLGLALGHRLKQAGQSVVFLDSNPQNCRRAEEEGFNIVYGDALQERTVQRLRPEAVGTVIGVTPNQMLNGVFVSQTRDRFGVPVGYVAVSHAEKGLAPDLVRSEVAEVLFDGPHDMERWDVRYRHDQVSIEEWIYGGAPAAPEVEDGDSESKSPAHPGERFVILAITRGKQVRPMYARFKLQAGDIATLAVHSDERERAHEILRELGWEVAPPPESGTEDSESES